VWCFVVLETTPYLTHRKNFQFEKESNLIKIKGGVSKGKPGNKLGNETTLEF